MTQKEKYNQKNRSKGINKQQQKKGLTIPPFLRNLLQVIFIVVFFYFITEHNKGYHWTLHTLILENLENIKKYKELSPEDRLKAKLGYTGYFLDHINKNTPEDAIIIMPPDSVYKPGKGKQKLDKYITTPGWTNYFVYPRKLIYEDDKEKYSNLYDSAQYVAVIDYWGYDKLNYKVNQKVQYTVLPKDYQLIQQNQQKQDK